jgi:hypothetical protein
MAFTMSYGVTPQPAPTETPPKAASGMGGCSPTVGGCGA